MKEAQALSLVGWVRNTNQGTVEGEAQGRPDKLVEFKVRACNTVYISTCTRSILWENNTEVYHFSAFQACLPSPSPYISCLYWFCRSSSRSVARRSQ